MTLAPVPVAPAYDPGSWSTFYTVWSLLGIALEVAAAWSLIVWVGKDARGRDISSGEGRI